MLQGNICALLAAKDHVNVFLYDGGIVPDPEGIITGGHDNKTARTVAIRQGETSMRPPSPPCSGKSLPTTGPGLAKAEARKLIADIGPAQGMAHRPCAADGRDRGPGGPTGKPFECLGCARR